MQCLRSHPLYILFFVRRDKILGSHHQQSPPCLNRVFCGLLLGGLKRDDHARCPLLLIHVAIRCFFFVFLAINCLTSYPPLLRFCTSLLCGPYVLLLTSLFCGPSDLPFIFTNSFNFSAFPTTTFFKCII